MGSVEIPNADVMFIVGPSHESPDAIDQSFLLITTSHQIQCIQSDSSQRVISNIIRPDVIAFPFKVHTTPLTGKPPMICMWPKQD
jgi:hypothetical protein